MDEISQVTLGKVQQNSERFAILELGKYSMNMNSICMGQFNSTESGDFCILGEAIGKNTCLTTLQVALRPIELGTTNQQFYNGLKRNSSINQLLVYCRNESIAGGIGQEILQAYKENKNLRQIHIRGRTNLQNGGEQIIADTLRSCANLKRILLIGCDITDEQLLPMVEAIRGHCVVSYLEFTQNRIGDAGCEALSTLLTDPNFNRNLYHLGLRSNNNINTEGVVLLLNSLQRNARLRELDFLDISYDQGYVQGVLRKLLCDTSSINAIHSSNHTLDLFSNSGMDPLLRLNSGINHRNRSISGTGHIAITKILKSHSNIDMEPLFEWEANDEQTLKALPYVINWFKRAAEAVTTAYDYRCLSRWDRDIASL